jgi:phosphatidylinositol-3,4,5-trisphosphate 3-phosphatase/dual-specificity protein phosphatase PTEN
MAAVARHLVSKKKRRFIDTENNFDLDLSYIECDKMAKKIIAMGFPSSGFEARYRNPLPEVQRFFKTFHQGHNRIYNLCSERDYKLDGLFDEVNHMFAFDDHNPCPLDLVLPFCANVSAYLLQDPDNVVGIHCKAGKGRTGMLICSFLVFKGYSARDALGIFADQRTHNSKGVTIPSQIRYVYYLEELLRPRAAPTVELIPSGTSAAASLPRPPVYKIFLVKLITTPNFDTYGGCDPYFKIYTHHVNPSTGLKEKTHVVFDLKKAAASRVVSVKKGVPYVSLNCNEHPVLIQGDVQLVLMDHNDLAKDEKMGGM